jgi:hypothetical protein
LAVPLVFGQLFPCTGELFPVEQQRWIPTTPALLAMTRWNVSAIACSSQSFHRAILSKINSSLAVIQHRGTKIILQMLYYKHTPKLHIYSWHYTQKPYKIMELLV